MFLFQKLKSARSEFKPPLHVGPELWIFVFQNNLPLKSSSIMYGIPHPTFPVIFGVPAAKRKFTFAQTKRLEAKGRGQQYTLRGFMKKLFYNVG